MLTLTVHRRAEIARRRLRGGQAQGCSRVASPSETVNGPGSQAGWLISVDPSRLLPCASRTTDQARASAIHLVGIRDHLRQANEAHVQGGVTGVTLTREIVGQGRTSSGLRSSCKPGL